MIVDSADPSSRYVNIYATRYNMYGFFLIIATLTTVKISNKTAFSAHPYLPWAHGAKKLVEISTISTVGQEATVGDSRSREIKLMVDDHALTDRTNTSHYGSHRSGVIDNIAKENHNSHFLSKRKIQFIILRRNVNFGPLEKANT